LQANEVAQSFFRQALCESREAEQARQYVETRGIDEPTAERFGVGYAPIGQNHLLTFCDRRGVSRESLEAAGLIGRRELGGHFVRFRGRLMFPIHDILGRVVGFGGRALREQDQPKYKNTPETTLFRKRELIYGLHLAKGPARDRNEIAVVEGYTDVILMAQAGFPWVVATLGTAFGADHARQLRRLVSRVVVFFDGDAAGDKANMRSLEELAVGVFRGTRPFEELRVARLPEGMDPAELVVQSGPAALREVVDTAQSLVEYVVPIAARGWSSERKVGAIRSAARILGSFEHAGYREVQLRDVAHRLGVSEAYVREEAVRARREFMESTTAAVDPQATSSEGSREPTVEIPRIERHALRCLLALPSLIDQARTAVPATLFEDERSRAIVEGLYAGVGVAEFESSAARSVAARIVSEVDPRIDYEKEWVGVLRFMERRRSVLAARTAGDDDASLRAVYETHKRLKARSS
jgi:DNA primase